MTLPNLGDAKVVAGVVHAGKARMDSQLGSQRES
jgi:hypothetical protein